MERAELRIVGAVVLLAIAGFAFVMARAVVVAASSGMYLKLRGVRARGTCVGMVPGRYGSGVAVRFEDLAGTTRTASVYGWNGTLLPEAGDPVEIVYSRRNPRNADRWPVRTQNAVGNVLYLGLCGLVIAALGAGALWVAVLAAWSAF
ncbi:hypothetical protein [Actinoallomurus iriomotensis]|uniref:DUF3592 domain-containing protein n=1 Tax=Actinoallomurus iriomotensis TaxID=478107 RepID=A0A9W6VYN5_9ACTN|nr:hypothetical protein [Actinoallomurus iriomotensis]GLY90263.1 hypothetical protein Airi02_081920 [Actinoallomurus iriomotensis]